MASEITAAAAVRQTIVNMINPLTERAKRNRYLRLEQYKNKMAMERGPAALSITKITSGGQAHRNGTSRLCGSGLRHLAGRTIRPVAVEPDHAPLDAPALADDARVLPDRVVHGVLEPIRYQRKRTAEPARYGLRRPGPECSLAHLLEPDDGEFRIPEAAFLLGEAVTDPVERGRCVARRQHAVVARSGQVE